MAPAGPGSRRPGKVQKIRSPHCGHGSVVSVYMLVSATAEAVVRGDAMLKQTVRHLLGAVAAWWVFVAQAAAAYTVLFGLALLTNAPLGSPLAGPMTVLLAAVLGAILVPLLFLPAGLVGEAATKHGRLFLRLVTTFAVAAALATIYVVVVAVATDASAAGTTLACLSSMVAALSPTVAYVVLAHAMSRTSSARRHFPSPASGPAST